MTTYYTPPDALVVTLPAGATVNGAVTFTTPPVGFGTVTSVALTAPSLLSVAGSPITGAGTLALSLASQSAHMVFAGPNSGSPAAPTFRALTAADLPSGLGTVTSVGLSAPAFLTVGGTPITSSGTLALTLATQSANLIFAGPSSGSAAAPTFRAIASADIATALTTPGPIGGSTPNSGSFTSLNVTGSSAPANGAFLSATNTLAFSTNSTAALSINAAQTVSFVRDVMINGIEFGNGSGGGQNVNVGGGMHSITTGYSNVAIGYYTANNMTSGYSNLALGSYCMSTGVVTGTGNTAIGAACLGALTSGNYNIAIGQTALGAATTGIQNVGIGLYTSGSLTTGSNNVAIGPLTMQYNITASGNTAIGFSALNLATGAQNLGVGYGAGSSITSGNYNVVIGAYNGSSIATLSNQIVISDGAGTIAARWNASGTLTNTGAIAVGSATVADASGNPVVRIYTVTTLPAAPGAGTIAAVSDATSPVKGSTLTGGGSTFTLVLYTGSAWVAG